jgi:hypothetical protein
MRHLIEYKNPIVMDGELKAYRKANGVITPDFAMDCLNKTNHVGNMRFIARRIASLDEKEWIKYKDFVLEAIEGRNQCDEVFNIFMNMAKKGNYLEQFIASHQKEKIYGLCDKVFECKTSNCREDLSKYDVLIVSNSAVMFGENVQFPKCVIFMNPDMISIRRSNFEKNKQVVFHREDDKRGASLWMYECSNLPEVLDASLFKEVDLSHSDLKDVKDIILGKKVYAKMIDAKNLPEKLNFSEVDNILLDDCDFSRTKEMILGKTKKLDLSGAKFLPSRLDFTQCEKIVLDGCDFEGVETIYFKDEENAMLIRDGINFENVDVFVGARKDPFDMNRITNSLLFLPKRKHIWDK